MHLPSTRYHRTLAPRHVFTPDEHDELEAAGWAETPAAFLDTPDDDATDKANSDAAAAPAKPAIAPKRKR